MATSNQPHHKNLRHVIYRTQYISVYYFWSLSLSEGRMFNFMKHVIVNIWLRMALDVFR